MKRARNTPEQVIRKLREGERMLAEGKDLADVCRALEISVQILWGTETAISEGTGTKSLFLYPTRWRSPPAELPTPATRGTATPSS
jgi:hypothetical protein